MIIIVGEKLFPDAAQMLAQRNAAAQAVARQQTSIINVEAAKAEAMKRSSQGQYVTVPTAGNPMIMRANNPLGATVPSLQSSRNLTPNGSVQTAMKPSMQTPPGVNQPLFTNQSSRPVGIENQYANAQATDKSRSFLTGVGYRRSL